MRRLLYGILVASLGAVFACSAVLDGPPVPFPVTDDDAGDARPAPPDPPDLTPGGEQDLPPKCTDACPQDGAKRCSASSTAGVETCGTSAAGCLDWKQDADCPPNFSCDVAKNDGSCKAGCTNDTGCSVANVGTARCILPTGPSGTAEQTCSLVGACYQWKTTRSSLLQQCTGSGSYCELDVRKNCVASPNGACTQHLSQLNACVQGSVCQGAGQCAQAPLCGGGLSCASVATTGATPCNQVLPPSAPVIYCCPAGQTIVAGKCQV